jgi:hypothetical protein
MHALAMLSQGVGKISATPPTSPVVEAIHKEVPIAEENILEWIVLAKF